MRKLSRKLLPLPVAPRTRVWPDVLHVQVEGVRRPVRRLERRQRLPAQMGTHRLAVIEREQKTQIGEIRLEQRQPPEVVRAVAWDDARATR